MMGFCSTFYKSIIYPIKNKISSKIFAPLFIKVEYMSLCKYRNILGEPNKGVHSYRIFNIAIVDVIATILVSYLIAYLGNFSFLWTLIFFFTLGILLHHIFCVRTTIDKLLFR